MPLLPPLPQGPLYSALRGLDLLFGRGVDDDPLWLLTVRVNVILFALCLAAVAIAAARMRAPRRGGGALLVALSLTALAALLRFAVAAPNLLDFGGIPYSRMLLGYRGHFATAQLYAPLYQLTARDIEHAVLFNRLAGTLTIPLVYALCRRLQPGAALQPALAAFLFAVSPLHILFSASDSLAASSLFLAALAYTLLAAAEDAPDGGCAGRYMAALSGLALLTQVRYENFLLLVPPALFLWAKRGALRRRALAPGALAAAAFLALYGYRALTSELTYRNPFHLGFGLAMIAEHPLLNPIAALPVLFVGTVAVALYRGPGWGALAALPWLPALALPVVAGAGHSGARTYCSWLILILPFAAHGFALLLAAPRLPARLLAALALGYLGAQPFLARAALSTQYLEMREHVFFRGQLDRLPRGVTTIVVPDDEMERRQTHSTIELANKYAMTLAGAPAAAGRVALVGLTAYLENPRYYDCSGGACAFFFGLPCLPQDVYRFAAEQCAALLRAGDHTAFAETTAVAAPFLHCSIYIGAQRAARCAPTMREQRLVWYRLGG